MYFFLNLSHQSHIDGHLDHWQIFAITSSVTWWPFFVSLMRHCARCWLLASLDFLFFSDLVNVLSAQGLLPLKKELNRGLPTPYSSWFEFENLYLVILWKGIKAVWASGGLRKTTAPKIKPWVTDRLDGKLSPWQAQVRWLGLRRARRTALPLSHYSLSLPQPLNRLHPSHLHTFPPPLGLSPYTHTPPRTR